MQNLLDGFYAITPYFNPIGYKSRPQLYLDFVKHMEQEGVKLYTIELAHGDKPFEVTSPDNPRHVQVRSNAVMFHKERLINLCAARLPPDWRTLAWIDGDIKFLSPTFKLDTVLRLQHHPVVQMFSDCIDLGPNNELISKHKSFGYGYHHRLLKFGDPYNYHHTGFAWAITRKAFNDLGGLLDICILGSMDYHFAWALVGEIDKTISKDYSDGYKYKLRELQADCDRYIQGNLGYVPGTIVHYYHGTKQNRQYKSRYKILTQHKFDPLTDLEVDWQGLYRWTDRKYKLHYDVYRYFLSRLEDN